MSDKNLNKKKLSQKNNASPNGPLGQEPETDTDYQRFLDKQKSLELWFQTALGRSLLASQRENISALIERYHGVHQAELGVSHRVPVGNLSNLSHKFFVLPEWQSAMPLNSVVSRGTEIGLASEIADLMILHHGLDFSANPHSSLREVSRVLRPSGTLVLVGFNPWSTWGLRKLFAGQAATGPWACRFINPRRVEDWLGLLNFKIESTQHFFYSLPFNQQKVVNAFSNTQSIFSHRVPLGAYYVMVAVKRAEARVGRSKRWSNKKGKVIGLPVTRKPGGQFKR